MKGKKILIAISGSIAAYKIPLLVRLLIKNQAEVKVILTEKACDFVSPLVLETLSKNTVLSQIKNESEWANHVMLGRWADLMIVAPASMNTIGKMANGLCDNLLTAVYFSATCPVWVAPAMDEDMYHHPVLHKNSETLKHFGNLIIPSEFGELASGLKGYGRMVEPETLFEKIKSYFQNKKGLEGKKAVVTAGPTYEALDPVRFIGNYSSGKMGVAIADTLVEFGCEVTLILGPSAITPDHPQIEVIHVQSAEQMFQESVVRFPEVDLAVLSAAVADYTPKSVATEKIKKSEDTFTIELTKSKDILKHLGSIKQPHQRLIGFALESTNEKEYAMRKLKEKNADLIIMNSLRDEGAGFGSDTNKITIFDTKGGEENFELKSKKEVSLDIVRNILSLW